MNLESFWLGVDLKRENDDLREVLAESYPSPPPSPKHSNASRFESGFVTISSEVKMPRDINFNLKSLKNTETYVKPQEPEEKKLKLNMLHKETSHTTCSTRVLNRPCKKLIMFDLKQDGYATHCYVCENRVKLVNLRFHLYFGDLKCETCGKIITSCMKFGNLNFRLNNTENCNHSRLEWRYPPVDSLKRLWDEDGKTFDESLTQYLKSLKYLKKFEPFKSAIRYCTEYLKEKFNCNIDKSFSEFENNLPVTSNTVTTDTAHGTNFSTTSQSSTIHVTDFPTTTQSNSIHGTDFPTTQSNTIHVTDFSTTQGNTINVSDFPTTQSNTIHGSDFSTTQSKATRGRPKLKGPLRKKKHTNNYTVPNTSHPQLQTNSTEEILEYHEILSNLPKTGFYFITRRIHNECPNCYESFDPKNLIFNTSNFLISTKCKNCSLSVFFVIDPPDKSKPKLKIISVL